MADYFAPNLEILAKKNRVLAQAVRDAGPDRSFEILPAESGQLTVRQRGPRGASRFIHSRVNPLQEARFWADCQRVDCGHAVIFGIGMAYHIAALRRVCPDCRLLVLMEADLSLFRLAMEFVDLADILADPAIQVAVGRDLAFLEPILAPHAAESFSEHPFLPVVSLHPERYEALMRLHDQYLYQARLHGRGEEPADGGMSIAAGVALLLGEMGAS